MKVGYVGLGKMGKNMVLRLLEQGIEVVAWNRSPGPREEVARFGAETVETVEELVKNLPPPRIIWLMLPAGKVVDDFVDQLGNLLSAGDLLIDGGNSFYQDSIKTGEKLAQKGIHFMDIGTSGGPGGARTGACLMIGGAAEDYQRVLELVKAAAAPEAFKHLGRVGAGHFAKMVHNGIEYGMMEAIGEGLAVLESSEFDFDLTAVTDIYQRRSVVESRLMDWARQALSEDPKLKKVSAKIGSGGGGQKRVLGEADWTVAQAKEEGVETPVMEAAIKVREDSQEVEENSINGFRNKVIQALRGQFGQHEVEKSK